MIRKKIIEHCIALILVGTVFGLLSFLLEQQEGAAATSLDELLREYSGLSFIDWNSPAQRALIKDVWLIYHPDQNSRVDSLLTALTAASNSRPVSDNRSGSHSGLTFTDKIRRLLPMYFTFIFVYVLVLLFSYYASQTAGIWRFVQMKRGSTSYLELLYSEWQRRPRSLQLKEIYVFTRRCLKFSGAALLKALVYLVLFSPAYVLAYAFKTRIDTNSVLFMILLGAFSNGLLITYTQKFFAYLVAESRKGYVQTAVVKNLKNSYDYHSRDGLTPGNIFRFKKVFPGHVFDHIYSNARYQYLPALKEQASFLITGLIIIEMALNIQNHLCYDLLQNLLYQDYVSVLIASFGIFLIIKSTEMITDILYLKETARYENR